MSWQWRTSDESIDRLDYVLMWSRVDINFNLLSGAWPQNTECSFSTDFFFWFTGNSRNSMSNLLVTVHMKKEVLPIIRIVSLLVRLMLLMIIAIEQASFVRCTREQISFQLSIFHGMFQFTLQFLHIFIGSLCRRERGEEREAQEIAAMHTHVVCYWMDFINFIRPSLSLSRAHKRNARRVKKKRGREIKVRPSRREESTRCPICTTPRENAFDCNCNEHTRKVSSGRGEATATTAARAARDVIQFHIQRFLKTFFNAKKYINFSMHAFTLIWKKASQGWQTNAFRLSYA